MEKKNILLVDDEIEFVSTLAERLRMRGFEADISTNGAEAMDKFNNADFDVVVLDIFMPGMSGLDVLKEIKKINLETPIILLTGHGGTKEGMEGMALGAYDYLMKPIDIDDLMSKINAATDKK